MKFVTCAFGLFLAVCSSASAQYLPTPLVQLGAVERALEDPSVDTMEQCLARNFGEATCVFLMKAREDLRRERVPGGYAIEVDAVFPGLVRFLLLKTCPLGNREAIYVNGWCVKGEETFSLKLSYWQSAEMSAVREVSSGFTAFVGRKFFFHVLREANALTPQGREMLGL